MNTTADFSAEDRVALVDTVQRFATQAIAPHVPAWEEAGELPRSLHRQAAELGLLGLGYPEHLGGTPAPWRARNAMSRALARHGGSGGVMASLFTHNIGLPPVLAHGTPELQQEVIPPVLRGEKIAALGITEPGGGSDVAALRTTARLEGDDYVIDGEKIFITSGMRCDWITLAVRTDAKSKGASGISMIVVPCDAPGLSRNAAAENGLAVLRHRAPSLRRRARARALPPGRRGRGLSHDHGQLQRRAPGHVRHGTRFCRKPATTKPWPGPRQRQTFGAALIERQVIRHKLMDMQMRIRSTRGLAGRARRARGRRRRRCRLGGERVPAQEPRHADDAVLRRRRRCRSWAAWATCAAP